MNKENYQISSAIGKDSKRDESIKPLADKLCELFGTGEIGDINEIKKKFETSFQIDDEFIDAVFSLRDIFETEELLDNRNRDKSERKKLFIDLTESSFLITHLLINADEETAEQFWRIAGILSTRSGVSKKLDGEKRGVLTQVAVYKIFDSISRENSNSSEHSENSQSQNFRPILSHPSHDAFEKTDLWIGGERVQVKGNKDIEDPEIIFTDSIAFPAVSIRDGRDSNIYLNSKYANEAAMFKAVIERYDRNAKGIMLVVPWRMIDHITGKPSPELIEFFKKELESRLNK
jgi:hypothetical protein